MSPHTRGVMVAALFPFVTACAGAPDTAINRDTWAGTITTEGNVTTVVNESGSVWGDVEIREVLSIGVPAGADPYMFGSVRVVAVDEPRIYVTDSQLSILRVYDDKTGAHLLDIGRQGEGPGELNAPWTMDVGPNGRVYVQDRRRVTVFAPGGRFVETWPYPWPFRGGGREMVVGNDGTVYVPSEWTVGDQRQPGYAVVSADGVEVGRIAVETSDRAGWRLEASNAISVNVPYRRRRPLPRPGRRGATAPDVYILARRHADHTRGGRSRHHHGEALPAGAAGGGEEIRHSFEVGNRPVGSVGRP